MRRHFFDERAQREQEVCPGGDNRERIQVKANDVGKKFLNQFFGRIR